MISALLNHIKKEKLFSSTEKVLLTVSGGIDSVLMCELFHKAGLNFGIAHCNFQLRAEESDDDETFVNTIAEKYNVPFHYIKFNTSLYAKKNKVSIQIAARDLRYQWFEDIRKEYKYNYIATAHHQDDSIETFFINLIRGTGISGLHGILPKHGRIIRPMLFTTKNEIEVYVKKHKLKYREDSSNASDKYVRNKIRHYVTPVLKELNPGFENTFNKTINHLREVELIYKNDIETKRSKIVKQEKNNILISIKQLKKLQPIATYLYEFLKPYHYNESTVEEIVLALDGESGKQFFSNTYRLIKDREFLIIEQRKENQEIRSKKQELRIKSQETGIKNQELRNKKPDPGLDKKDSEIKVLINQKAIDLDNLKLSFKSEVNNLATEIQKSASIAYLDLEKLEFPLEIRKWQKGDVFYPFGMKGKKKLSDFFIDKKLSLNQKENAWLLTSKGKIAWVIGQRIDNRFKITEKTRKIYIVKLI
ncbi:MAG: tRNA lysidine(34) synthetase TilS [Bacteroidia bacterium]|nr:tRNA lysidine(34) synthetase TilS [Bacteroidia bacterium]